jgi:ATP-dependent Clp protease ATP-binding subunit ClpX
VPARNQRLFTGTQASICETCISACSDMMSETEDRKKTPPPVPLPKPTEIRAFLDHYIIGQDEAKKTVSVAVYNH